MDILGPTGGFRILQFPTVVFSGLRRKHGAGLVSQSLLRVPTQGTHIQPLVLNTG